MTHPPAHVSHVALIRLHRPQCPARIPVAMRLFTYPFLEHGAPNAGASSSPLTVEGLEQRRRWSSVLPVRSQAGSLDAHMSACSTGWWALTATWQSAGRDGAGAEKAASRKFYLENMARV